MLRICQNALHINAVLLLKNIYSTAAQTQNKINRAVLSLYVMLL